MNSSSGSGGRAALAAERVEVRVQVGVGAPELGAELVPARRGRPPGSRRTSAARRGSLISAGLQETIRTHGRPHAGSAAKLTTLSSTITSGWTSSMISRSRSSTYLAPSTSAWNVGAMNSPSCSIVGLRNTGAVSRMKSFQNCPGSSSTLRRRPEPHQPLLEPLRLERAGERLLDDEHHPVAAPAQHVADPDAVVRRPVRALGEEHDRAHARARYLAGPALRCVGPAPVAQWIERSPPEREVAGSNPAGRVLTAGVRA